MTQPMRLFCVMITTVCVQDVFEMYDNLSWTSKRKGYFLPLHVAQFAKRPTSGDLQSIKLELVGGGGGEGDSLSGLYITTATWSNSIVIESTVEVGRIHFNPLEPNMVPHNTWSN